MIIIGRNPILETLKHSPETINKIVLLNALNDVKIMKILALAEKNNIIIEKTVKADFEKLFDEKNKSDGISQGIIADVEDFHYSNFNDVLNEIASKDRSVVVILDEIQDPHNLGAIIRTSAAAGADAIIISEKNSAKVNHTVIKTSSGATNYIKICLQSNIYKAIEQLKESSFRVVGTTLSADSLHYDYDYTSRSAIVFGNEGEGLRKNIIKICDSSVRIPIAGKIESLNVSVSAGVILYEIFRQNSLNKSHSK